MCRPSLLRLSTPVQVSGNFVTVSLVVHLLPKVCACPRGRMIANQIRLLDAIRCRHSSCRKLLLGHSIRTRATLRQAIRRHVSSSGAPLLQATCSSPKHHQEMPTRHGKLEELDRRSSSKRVGSLDTRNATSGITTGGSRGLVTEDSSCQARPVPRRRDGL